MSRSSQSFFSKHGLKPPECHHIRIWENPSPADLGNSVEEFLSLLEKPTLLLISGKEHQEIRAVCTLLHGNEPSGLKAVYRWLKHEETPYTDVICFIGAVKAAKTAPGFYYRHLPGQRDMNRCFGPESFSNRQTKTHIPHQEDDEVMPVAKELMALLDYFRPASLIDIHNTSGKGPAFAVSISGDHIHIGLAALFTHQMIITDIRLGAIMELSSARMPIVTIECGGVRQDESLETAVRGLQRYVSRPSLFAPADEASLLHSRLTGFETLHNPVRIELTPEASIDYLNYKHPQTDVTLLPSIEEDNFGIIPPDKALGWIQGDLSEVLQALNSCGQNIIHQVLQVREGKLYPARSIKMFMATTNASIAKSDCLFYAVDADGREIKALS